MSLSLGRENKDGFYGETNVAVAVKNYATAGVSLCPSEWCRVGERSCLAALSTFPYSGDECTELHVLHW